MGTIEVSAERPVAASADAVYGWLADYVDHHQRFLPAAFSGYSVESGGVGAGTIVSFSVTAGGRTRPYRMTVSEPEPGRVLKETDGGSSLVTTFTVTPVGEASTVRIITTWQGAGGIGGFFERRFAPKVLERLYVEEIERIDAYARNPGA
jgi:Polyketide cyclase / dehydrase and lipid transport